MLKYHPLGDSAFIIKFGDIISPEIHNNIRSFILKLEESDINGVTEWVPTYNELLVYYNHSKIGYDKLLKKLKEIEQSYLSDNATSVIKVLHIPVCYEPDFALDLDIVAQTNNISVNDVIKLHTAQEYLVYMLGFTPGFCYLGGMNKRIATPRKENPRINIEAGSVGIADKQTGIYPINSPGGWQIIGKTPLKLFDPEREPVFLIESGDYIKFDSIDLMKFKEIESQINQGVYELKVDLKDV